MQQVNPQQTSHTEREHVLRWFILCKEVSTSDIHEKQIFLLLNETITKKHLLFEKQNCKTIMELSLYTNVKLFVLQSVIDYAFTEPKAYDELNFSIDSAPTRWQKSPNASKLVRC